jgi:hypothetical protein
MDSETATEIKPQTGLPSMDEIKKTNRKKYDWLLAIIIILVIFFFAGLVGLIIYQINIKKNIYDILQYNQPYMPGNMPGNMPENMASAVSLDTAYINSLSSIFSNPTHSYASLLSAPINPQTQKQIHANTIISPINHPSLASTTTTLKNSLPSSVYNQLLTK